MEINLEMPLAHSQDDKLDTTFNSCTNEFHAGEDISSLPAFDANTKDPTENANIICSEPCQGLEFNTKEAAYSFYREYACSMGFGITIKASRRSKKSGKFIDVKIVCSRFGNKRQSTTSTANVPPRSCPKSDCKAAMHIKRRQENGKWYIYCFIKDHNHEMCPDDIDCAIRGRSKQSGSVACTKKKGLQLALDADDVKLLLGTFNFLQSKTSNFHYAVDLDKERHMRNVFWIDSKGRHDYGLFSDVVFFDTSYLKNGYKVPFVPIVGVNHHFQYILLGSALAGDETSLTFTWLMRTWLRAVGSQSPKVVITADDMSLKEAVADVFPDARHCFSLRNILSEISQNLNHKVNQFPNFMSKFNKCIYQSWTDEEFHRRWHKMVDRFDLRDDQWIKSLYKDHRKWVPTYMRDTFLGGLSSIEPSESRTSFIDKYIHKETTFKEFIDQYKFLLDQRYEKEERAELETRDQKPTLISISPFEKQMSKIYTQAVFKKFQAEVLGTFACNVQREAEDETTLTFRVIDLEDHKNFIVAWNEGKFDISCLCRSFEYRGFLCRHAMIVLQMLGISSIPSRYILKRLTRDAKIRDPGRILPSRLNFRVQRLNTLCKFAIKLGEEGSLSQETYNIALFALEQALKHCVGFNNSVRSVVETNALFPKSLLNSEDQNLESNTVKPPKKKRILKKRKAQQDAEAASLGIHDGSQKMESGTRTRITDGYYGAQQSVQVLGQLSSLALLREGYYRHQQSVEGLLGNFKCTSPRVGHYAPEQSLQRLLQGQLDIGARSGQGSFDIQDTLHHMEEK